MATTDVLIRAMLADVYGNVATSVNLAPYVTAANLIVDEDLADADPALSTARKDIIATFLGCHFATIAMFHGGLIKKQAGNSSEAYSTPDGDASGFEITHWGKQALALDTSGTLKDNSISSRYLSAEFEVLTGRELYDTDGARSDGVGETDAFE